MTDLHKAAQQVLDALELAATYGSLIGPQSVIDAHEAAITALREALAAPVVPPGYALVPVEPTPEMCQSAQKAGFFQSHAPIIWKALLSAAPQPKDKP